MAMAKNVRLRGPLGLITPVEIKLSLDSMIPNFSGVLCTIIRRVHRVRTGESKITTRRFPLAHIVK